MAELLGMRLDAAEEVLKQRNIPYEIRLAEPSGRKETEGELRVIRQKEEGDLLLLTVCKIPDPFL